VHLRLRRSERVGGQAPDTNAGGNIC
jgi:hypothetical protein